MQEIGEITPAPSLSRNMSICGISFAEAAEAAAEAFSAADAAAAATALANEEVADEQGTASGRLSPGTAGTGEAIRADGTVAVEPAAEPNPAGEGDASLASRVSGGLTPAPEAAVDAEKLASAVPSSNAPMAAEPAAGDYTDDPMEQDIPTAPPLECVPPAEGGGSETVATGVPPLTVLAAAAVGAAAVAVARAAAAPAGHGSPAAADPSSAHASSLLEGIDRGSEQGLEPAPDLTVAPAAAVAAASDEAVPMTDTPGNAGPASDEGNEPQGHASTADSVSGVVARSAGAASAGHSSGELDAACDSIRGAGGAPADSVGVGGEGVEGAEAGSAGSAAEEEQHSCEVCGITTASEAHMQVRRCNCTL